MGMESVQGAEQLIPGLPFDLAVACLLKVPRLFHLGLRGVSRIWRHVLCSQDFYRWRRHNGFPDPWLVILSTYHMGSSRLGFFAYDLPSRQLLFKAPLPPVSMLPIEPSGADSYKLAGMNEYFMVLHWQKTGIWTEELPFLIYNSLTNYNKGACVSVRRQSFSCGIIKGKLYITAGFNLEGRFEHSTECYDFVKDEWKFMASHPRVEAGFELEHVVDAILEVEDDAVFQGQLYLRFRLHSRYHEASCDKLYVVYDPITDTWQEKQCPLLQMMAS